MGKVLCSLFWDPGTVKIGRFRDVCIGILKFLLGGTFWPGPAVPTFGVWQPFAVLAGNSMFAGCHFPMGHRHGKTLQHRGVGLGQIHRDWYRDCLVSCPSLRPPAGGRRRDALLRQAVQRHSQSPRGEGATSVPTASCGSLALLQWFRSVRLGERG